MAKPQKLPRPQNLCTEGKAVLNFDSEQDDATNKVYDEVIEFIASSSPQNMIAFRTSEEAKARVADLIFRKRVKDYQTTRNPNLIFTYRLST
jgi:hypothetical protein